MVIALLETIEVTSSTTVFAVVGALLLGCAIPHLVRAVA